MKSDTLEETFLLFSNQLPSYNLGYTDPKATELTVQVGDRDVEILQSPGLLMSNRDAGTTGAVLWKVSPLVAAWLVAISGPLWRAGILHPRANVVELGCGIAGILGLSLSPLVSTYLLTDQEYVMKILKENVALNQSLAKLKKRGRKKDQQDDAISPRLRTLTLDWETDSATNVQHALGPDQSIDLVVACDCIYNDFLIKPFVGTCADLCKKRSSGKVPVLLVAQQLRSEEIFEEWLQATMQLFHVWRVPNDSLNKELQDGSGYTLHLAILIDQKT